MQADEAGAIDRAVNARDSRPLYLLFRRSQGVVVRVVDGERPSAAT